MTKITKEDPVPGRAPDLWQPEGPDELPDPHALLACWETANCGYAEQQQLVADRWRLSGLACRHPSGAVEGGHCRACGADVD